ncbi:MAG: tripartite tricarboxylate transporter substrate binding protein, partial [Rubritepida sp.]|nr:tripartite tricarboxylate transporter substrate binding protein [Rubritepida sp.]
FDVDQLVGVLAPAGTPSAIVQLLATKLRDAVRDPNGITRLRRAGFDPVGTTPEEFRAVIARELPKWREVISRAGIRLDL